jgi:small GTP-binding protein
MAIQDKQVIYSFKIVIVGGPGVGKTCLFNRFCFNSFTFDTSMTIGINFHSMMLPLEAQQKFDPEEESYVSNSIFDFGGQERFKPLIPKFLKGADGALLVLDLTSSKSLDDLEFWHSELLINTNYDEIPKILVGSKSDLLEENPKLCAINDERIEVLKTRYYISSFYKTSALKNHNVLDVFKELNERMLMQKRCSYRLA